MSTAIACLTSTGTAALATLAVRGPLAWAVTSQLFRVLPRGKQENPACLPEQPKVGQSFLGRLGEGKSADDVVVVVKKFEPVPWLEIHCHGGREAIRLIMEYYESRGVQAVSWQELEKKTRDDFHQIKAQEELVLASTTRTAGILLDQYHGAFRRALAAIQENLQVNRKEKAQVTLERLAQLIPSGRHLTAPWQIVIAGAPNVGKSSLANALAGFTRSVVSPLPGTTRDVVTTRLAIDGWPIELADTAGWRLSGETLEQAGIAQARASAAAADLVLWVLDASQDPYLPDPEEFPFQVIINKIDLPPAWDLQKFPEGWKVSAKTGEGLAQVCQGISQRLAPTAPQPGEAVPFTPEMCACIEDAYLEMTLGSGERVLSILENILGEIEFR